MYEKELQSLGLSEKEAKVYLASLDLGADTAQNLSKKAGVNRATTYVQIESLKIRGLMSEFDKGKKTMYVAETPERLTGLFHSLEAEVELKKNELANVLPALVHMFSGMGERPRVRYFVGMEGLRHMRSDLSKLKTKEICSFANLDLMFEHSPEIENFYTKERVTQGVHSKVIYTRKAGQLPGATDSTKLREAKYVEPKEFPFSSDITIYDGTVVFESYRSKVVGIIIENSEIANTLRAVFTGLWNRI